MELVRIQLKEKNFLLEKIDCTRKRMVLVAKNNNKSINCKARINKVFVYGTLMKDFCYYKWYLEGRINRITPGRTYGLLYHLPEGYPALLPGNGIIEGEVMEPVDGELLKSLDRLEDYDEFGSNNLYAREIRSISTERGEDMICWIYIFTNEKYAKENGILVPNGNWRKFMGKRGELI
ncbi:MAG TPA: gamma-glutamylcyclotransferase [Pseudobacteroides sp.]|nr:gamma-glutamylcyclotransferase [Pseudobacteroides sp.]